MEPRLLAWAPAHAAHPKHPLIPIALQCDPQKDFEQVLTGRVHLAFQAQNRDMVHAFYEAALAHGGQDHGPPGERPYHPGYYAAFVLDPDGNNIEAVFHGDAKRSVPSVEITF